MMPWHTPAHAGGAMARNQSKALNYGKMFLSSHK
jgi:hypothetical protein